MDLGQHEGGATISTPVPANFSPFEEAAAKLKLLVAGGGNANANGSGNSPVMEEGRSPLDAKVKKAIRYRECLKNHAASLGGYALDGCGEFMPSGEEGSLEALKCAACHCHRNFHRREVEGEHSCECARQERSHPSSILPPHTPLAISPSATFPRPPQMIMALNAIPSESDDHAGFPSPPPIMLKRRFRTKFTAEQKERMLSFAEQLGWRLHKQNEAAVEQLCSEVNVTRNVFKVWMHNNKNTLGKKLREDFLLAPETTNPDDMSTEDESSTHL